MKRKILLLGIICMSGLLSAHTDDPVLMKINGKDVYRSEFEYNYNKNNGQDVVDKKTVEEYADLFVNYKLKVEAALDAKYDTLSSFKKEFRVYRDQLIRPYFVTPQAEEAEVKGYYERMKQNIGSDGLILPAHIMIMLSQKATEAEQQRAKEKIDSIYAVLKAGGPFEELAKTYSEDRMSAQRGGVIAWISKGQTVKEFEEKAFALNKGEMSEPFMSPMGYHIVLMKDRKQLEPYDQLKDQIRAFLEQRGMKDKIVSVTLDSISRASGNKLTAEDILDQKAAELSQKDNNLKYLIQEYHDGLLLYEVSSREIWNKAADDEAGLENYFKKNKSKYKWTDGPRYRGVVYHCKDEALVKEIRKFLKSVDENQWIDSLRASYNRDSVQQIRVEKNFFKKGDNAYVDHLVFKVKEKPEPLKDFPYYAVYGKKLKKPKQWTDVKSEVISDYQSAQEALYVADLRKKYKVEIYKEVLNTVNKH